MIGRVVLLVAIAALVFPAAISAAPAPAIAHYVPRAGDEFEYAETIVLNNGEGANYAGYTEHTFTNGSITVRSIASNESVTTGYAWTSNYYNSSGGSQSSSMSGTFGWSASTFLYVNGTDDQTGYTNPSVWFFIDNTLGVGGSATLLNTPVQVIGTSATYPMASSATGYVVAIEAEGNGSYERDDSYGIFEATYTWIAYFDPGTGYILGYSYVEHDSNASGEGFTWTDTLSDTQTSFPLTAASAPPPASSAPASPISETVVVVLVVVVVVVLALVILALRARRRSAGMAAPSVPRHGGPAAPPYPPTYGAPPPVNLVPGGQPAVQQIVIRETVKVPCAFCGTLMDSTATVCPKCGAPRT
jgi:hypothetical protein